MIFRNNTPARRSGGFLREPGKDFLKLDDYKSFFRGDVGIAPYKMSIKIQNKPMFQCLTFFVRDDGASLLVSINLTGGCRVAKRATRE